MDALNYVRWIELANPLEETVPANSFVRINGGWNADAEALNLVQPDKTDSLDGIAVTAAMPIAAKKTVDNSDVISKGIASRDWPLWVAVAEGDTLPEEGDTVGVKKEQWTAAPGRLGFDVLAVDEDTRLVLVMPQASAVQRFRIVSEADDYLVCHVYNADPDLAGSGEGTEVVNVAKPFLLRRTPFDGESIDYGDQTVSYSYDSASSRETTSDDGTETHVLTPAYFAGEEIVAFRDPGGGTGVVDDEGETVIFEEKNAGRFWSVPES